MQCFVVTSGAALRWRGDGAADPQRMIETRQIRFGFALDDAQLGAPARQTPECPRPALRGREALFA